MRTIALSHLLPFDVLLYPRNCIGVKFYHAAWYVGKIWGMRVNFESTRQGPELKEWPDGDLPKYVLRIRELNDNQKTIIILTCRGLKDKKYDLIEFLAHPLRRLGIVCDNKDRIRCDENIVIPMEAAGINLNLKEENPKEFLKCAAFTVYELKKGGDCDGVY